MVSLAYTVDWGDTLHTVGSLLEAVSRSWISVLILANSGQVAHKVERLHNK